MLSTNAEKKEKHMNNFSLDDFGIKSNSYENEYKKTLLKIAYSASDYEAKSYCEIIDTLNKIMKYKK